MIDTLFLSNVCDRCDSAVRLFLFNNDLSGSIPGRVCDLRSGELSSLVAPCSVCNDPNTAAGCCTNCS